MRTHIQVHGKEAPQSPVLRRVQASQLATSMTEYSGPDSNGCIADQVCQFLVLLRDEFGNPLPSRALSLEVSAGKGRILSILKSADGYHHEVSVQAYI